jgi:hypothetical protein
MTSKLHNYPVKLHMRRICHISFTKWQMRFTVNLSDNSSGEASQDNCEAYLSFCESNDTLPRTTFTVYRTAVVPTSNVGAVSSFYPEPDPEVPLHIASPQIMMQWDPVGCSMKFHQGCLNACLQAWNSKIVWIKRWILFQKNATPTVNFLWLYNGQYTKIIYFDVYTMYKSIWSFEGIISHTFS